MAQARSESVIATDQGPPCPAQITGRWAYVDTIQLWLTRPMTRAALDELKTLCGSVTYRRESMRFDRRYVRRLVLHQPTELALRRLRDVANDSALINRVDFALDLTTTDFGAVERLKEFFDRHWVRPRRGKQLLGYAGTTSYSSDRRWVPNNNVVYAAEFSKATGEVDCLRLEWRICGAPAVRRARISLLDNLIGFDHRDFWSQKLQLRAIDLGKLGRIRRRTRRRTPWIKKYRHGCSVDMDRRAGNITMRAAQRMRQDGEPMRPLGCVEEVKAYLKTNIGQALVTLPNDLFLPD